MAQDAAQREQSSMLQIGLLCGSFFFLFMGVGALQQFLVPILTSRTGVSDTGASAIFSIVYFGGPVWLWLYGYYFRVLREKWSIVLAGLTYTLFGVGVYYAQDYRLALLAAIIWSWGGETLWATGPAQVINVANKLRYGSIAGLFQSSTYLGQMIGVILLGWLLSRAATPQQGQDTVLICAVVISFVGNILSVFLRVRPKERPPARLADAVVALRRPAGRYLVLLSVANYLGWGLVLTSFTLLLAEAGQLSRLHWIVLPYYAGRLAVAWGAGHISDKVGRERVMMAGFILGAVSLAIVGVSLHIWAVAFSALILGMQAAMVSVAGTAAVGDYIHEDERHLVFAGTNAWGYLTAGTVMISAQFLRDLVGNFAPSFIAFAVFYALCALVALKMRRRMQQNGPLIPAAGS